MVANQINPAVTNAVDEMKILLHEMNTDNLGESFQKIDVIRHTLKSEQEELEVVSKLITMGEL